MSEAPSGTLLDRAFGRMRRAWRDVAGLGRGNGALDLRPDLPADDEGRLRQQIDACLEGRGGEVSARSRAAGLGRAYLGLNAKGRKRFLHVLADHLAPEDGVIEAALEAARGAEGAARVAALENLRVALKPKSIVLFRQFNALDQGVKFLVDLRAELLALTRGDAKLATLDRELEGLLASWFDIGFLELRRITWEAPAALLEKLIAYEAVHEIRSWDDLKNRLDSDRRLYAFFHPGMPEEPLIFIEVALVKGMASSIDELLDESAPPQDPRTADTAIFYSISNAQAGLRGVSFGTFLIRRVVDDLSRDFNGLKTFATLSPIPGFRSWLDRRIEEGDKTLLSASEAKQLRNWAEASTARARLAEVLARPDWLADPAIAEALRIPLLRLCAQYLSTVREDGRALDPVAHFHLSNGARIERLNWRADLSAKGEKQSAGLMVNYRYKLPAIETNHEAYSGRGKIAKSAAMRALLKP